MRVSSDSCDISSEKIATGWNSRVATCQRDVQRQRRLAHGRTRRQDDQFARVQAAGHLVQLREARADTLDALARIEERVEAALVVLDDFERRFEALGPCAIRPV